jgi:hypothetical protein
MPITINSDSNSRVSINDNQGLDLITDAISRARISSIGLQSSVVPDLSGSNTTLFPEYKCRAWVNFNGTGGGVIRGSGNVTSVTKNDNGRYTVNFTINMPDANYCANVTPKYDESGFLSFGSFRFAQTASAVQVICGTTNGTVQDSSNICVVVFR